MTALVTSLGVLLLIATLLPIVRHEAWWIRVLDFPRMQLIAALVVIIVALAFVTPAAQWTVALAGALGVSLLYHLYRVLPFSPIWKRQVADCVPRGESDGDLSIVVANVLMENRTADDLIEMIEAEDPDIIFAVETDQWWVDILKRFEASHPHTLFCPQDNTYGLALLSKLPATSLEVRHLVQEDVPSIVARFVLRNGREFAFYGIHPRPPHPEHSKSTAPRDAELLIVGREVADADQPVIVAGDLNDVAWSHTTRLFQRVSGLLDPRRGRGMFNTFHADWWFARWPLDHVFHSGHFQLSDLQRLPAFGSDHFPVLARLVVAPAGSDDPPPQADEADAEELERKIDDAKSDEATIL